MEEVAPPAKKRKVAIEIDDDDPIQKTLKRAAQAKRESKKPKTVPSLLQPPPQTRCIRSPSEEVERIEPERPPKPPPKAKIPSQTLSSQPDRDEAFLSAVAKANKRANVDAPDKEFNQLKIPKAQAKETCLYLSKVTHPKL